MTSSSETNSGITSARRKKPGQLAPLASAPGTTSPLTKACPARNHSDRRELAVAVAIVAVSFLWAYWSTIAQLASIWSTQPDYSHGFLVPILAAFFMWNDRSQCPARVVRFAWPGLLLILLGSALRVIAGYYYVPTIDGWSMPLWILGAVWMLGGWPIARWCLPPIFFLYFMVPLPYRMESWLSLPLQSAATHLSVFVLQCLGQPALAEGHTIHLGIHRLEVEQACSGLRMLFATTALAVAYTLVIRRTWWERALVLASVVPIALVANTARIAVTGLLYQYVSNEAGKKFTHDFAGWAMILLAAALFSAVLWYVNRLFPIRERVELSDLLWPRPVDLVAQVPNTHSVDSAS